MSAPPAGLEIKTLAVLDRPATAPQVAPQGVVTALVAVTGIRDYVGDVITPGAFARTLRERGAHPRLLHNWHRQIGHTLWLKELPPGDAALPATTPDGRPWPAEAGALVAQFQLDLSTKDGRRALSWAQGRLGAPPWYSIGYVPISPRRLGATRHLDDLDLWEYSMVYHPANGLAGQVDFKGLSNLVSSEHQVPPPGIEVKVRYVRDAGYWGYPVGTIITETMRPKGKTAVTLRRAGRVPARTVGTTAEKPKEGARSKPAKPEEEGPQGLFPEADTGARVRAGAAATGDIEGATTSLIEALQDERYGDPATAIRGLLHEGVTPLELEEDLRVSERWPTSLSDAERDDLIESALTDYRNAYRERVARQAQRRAAAAEWTPPSRETLDRVAQEATRALESFEEQHLVDALAELGHDDPEGFAAHLLGEDTKMSKATAELSTYLDERRGLTESSGDITERLGDLSARDDQELLDLRRDVASELDTDDGEQIAAAEAAVDAEIAQRGIIAIRDVRPGDVFEFNDQRYYVVSDGSLIDPEGELSNLPRTGYQGRPAKLIERDAPMPVRKIDTEQLAASGEHVVTGAPAGKLDVAEYNRQGQRADARRARLKNIADEQEQADREAAWAAAADALADAAPAQLDLEALRTRRQLIGNQAERRRPIEVAGGGRLAIVGNGSKGWSVVTGSGMQLVNASSFEQADGGKAPGRRALADLANRLASLTDAAGRPAPFTATHEQQGGADRPDWVLGWRDEDGRTLAAAAAQVLQAWGDANGLTFRYSARNYHNPPTVPGGEPDTDGFRARRVDEIAPGDEIRLPDETVGTVERNGRHGDGSNFDRIILVDGQHVPVPKAAGLAGSTMDVRFAGDPDAVEARQDPGMGNIAATIGAPPGQPIKVAADQWDKRWPLDYSRPLEPGTRLVEQPPEHPSTVFLRDNRPRVGVAMARLDHAGGHEFQTIRWDDGTYSQLNIDSLRRRGGGDPKHSTFVIDPTPEQVNAARAAWNLSADENAGPGGNAPKPRTLPRYTPPPKLEPEPITPREQQTRDRIHQGPRAYGQWVPTATDDELAEEDRILTRMRDKMPISGSSNAIAFTHFTQRYVQPVRRERERRTRRPTAKEPEPPTVEPPPVAEPPAPEPVAPIPGSEPREVEGFTFINATEGANVYAERWVAYRADIPGIPIEAYLNRDGTWSVKGGPSGDRYTSLDEAAAAFLDWEYYTATGLAEIGKIQQQQEKLRAKASRLAKQRSKAGPDKYQEIVRKISENRAEIDRLETTKEQWRHRPVVEPEPELRQPEPTPPTPEPEPPTATGPTIADLKVGDTFISPETGRTITVDKLSTSGTGRIVVDGRDEVGNAEMNSFRPGDPITATGPAPGSEPPPVVEIPQEQLDEATDLSDELFGITELPDGMLEVDTATAERQDRVAALLEQREAGALDLTTRDDGELATTRDDLHAELGLQMALERRQQRTAQPRAPRGPASAGGGEGPPNPEWGQIYGGGSPSYLTNDGTPVWMFRRGQRVRFYDNAGNQVGPEQGNVAPAVAYAADQGWRSPPAATPAPAQRPGLIGAAQDHAEALRSGDAEAIARTRARLESSLRRSRAASPTARTLADHVTADTPNDAAALEDFAKRLKAETRERRAASARRRRTVRRLERDRIRSLLGEVDAELRLRTEVSSTTAPSLSPDAATLAANYLTMHGAEGVRARIATLAGKAKRSAQEEALLAALRAALNAESPLAG